MKKISGRLLFLMGNGKGLLFRRLTFYVVDLASGERQRVASIPAGAKERILCRNRLAVRLLRLEPKCTGRLDENRYVVCVLGKVWLLDIKEKKITEIVNLRPGYSILNFCEKDGYLYWGDYGSNNGLKEIRIYKMGADRQVKVAYTFEAGTGRHIHNIIKDGDGFIVMAGDNEKQAGIYRANADWTEVRPWKTGEQKYRAVVGFAYKGGLLYATDSVEKENHLRYISPEGEEHILTPMNGSCIYGGETKDYYVFSTTVESPERGGRLGLLSRKLGGGIKSDEVYVVALSKASLDIKVIGKFKKDFWPMKLLQYGQAIFAGGQEESKDGVWCYPMSCKKYDGKSVYLRINE